MKFLFLLSLFTSMALAQESYSEKRKEILSDYKEAKSKIKDQIQDRKITRKEYQNEISNIYRQRNQKLRELRSSGVNNTKKELTDSQQARVDSMKELGKLRSELRSGKISKKEFKEQRREIIGEMKKKRSRF